MAEQGTDEPVIPGVKSVMVRRAVSYALVAVIGFVLGASAYGTSTGAHIVSNIPLLSDGLDATPNDSVDFGPFWKIWNELDKKYVITHASSTLPSAKEKMWGAMQGLVASYGDPYTVFMPPKEAKEFEDNVRGDFEGVGMEMGIRDGALVVIAPLKKTPAERAGVRPGDKILAIDGKKTDGMTTEEAVKLIRGPHGTPVLLKMGRGDKTLDIKIIREVIDIPVVDFSNDAKTKIFSIELYSFTGTSDRLFRDAVNAFKASGSEKLIIDLRGNPGGYLDAAVSIAGHFLPKGSLVVTEDYGDKQESVTHRTEGPFDVPATTKIVVLVDEGSASASEILAGALQDHKTATVIGAQSFGKGSVQQLIDVDGGSLKLTVARWITPNGHWIMGNGITPDIKATRTMEDAKAQKDPQKDRAIEFLTTGK